MKVEDPLEAAGAAIKECLASYGLPDLQTHQCNAVAACVLRSVHEPSQAMMEAGTKVAATGACVPPSVASHLMRDAWWAMIDVALTERRADPQ